MLRFALREAARLILNVVGAALMAAAVSTLSAQEAWRGAGSFFASFGARLQALGAFDFGTSAVSGQPALSELAARLPETATILLAGALVALAIGVPLGIVFAGGPTRRAR
jgi:peptide/nickel transport system permease protein